VAELVEQQLDVGPEQLRALEEAFACFTSQTTQLKAAYLALKEKAEQIDLELEAANRELERKVRQLDEVSNLQRSILHSIPTAVVVTDLEGVINTFNPAAERMWGVPAEEAVGVHFRQVMDPHHRLLAGVLAGRYRQEALRRELAGSEPRIISSTACLVEDSAGRPIGALQLDNDITRLRRLEAELCQREKLADLGQMAAGLAHEIRKPLNGIKGFASLLGRRLQEGETEQRYVGSIMGAADRLDSMLGRLLDFARPDDVRCATCDLRAEAEEVAAFVRAEERSGARIAVQVPEQARAVRADRDKLKQVLLNLLGGAGRAGLGDRAGRAAVPGGGAARPRQRARHRQGHRARRPGPHPGAVLLEQGGRHRTRAAHCAPHSSTTRFATGHREPPGRRDDHVVPVAGGQHGGTMIRKVLIADDEATDRRLMEEILKAVDEELQVVSARDGEEACSLIERDSFDLVLTDLKMPRKGGLQVLEKARAVSPPSQVVIVTGFADVPTAVDSIKRGGFDYLLKPICVDQVEMLLRRVKEHVRLVEENRYLHAELAGGAGDIIGESSAIKDVCRKAVFVAATDATVLLQGESGTGKELVSRLIHNRSPRREGPFIRVNCAALSESILESELFGHEKGAFTGAHTAKPGRFELADGGTLLLDEITETSEKLQAELLRVIEEKEFERVGGTRTVRVDVRIIATTNRDLAREVAERRFREDLYYRLNVVPLVLPPLRERDGDVDLLVSHFVEKFAGRLGKDRPQISDGAMAALRRYPWPGNVRELENLIQRLVIMDTDGVIDCDDLPEHVGNPAAPSRSGLLLGGTLEDIERHVILQTLASCNGNRTRAAERLDISTRTIRNKLKKYMEEGLLDEKISA